MEIYVTFEPLDGFSNFKKVKWWEFNLSHEYVTIESLGHGHNVPVCPGIGQLGSTRSEQRPQAPWSS